jgi:Ca-activated chloride channel homolog
VAAEDQILAAVAPVAGGTRIFALGIDQAVNAGFLRRLAALGAGRCELVESQQRLDDVMASLHRRITPPVLTGLRVEAEGVELAADQTTPSTAPDLFPGAPCTLYGRWRAGAAPTALTLTVHGDAGYREQVAVTAAPDRAVRTCWARARVRDLEDTYAAGDASPELADRIVAVSLAHRVLSRFTAFVAVDRSRRTDPGAPQPVIQPVELPRGWTAGGPAPMPLVGGTVPQAAARQMRLRAGVRLGARGGRAAVASSHVLSSNAGAETAPRESRESAAGGAASTAAPHPDVTPLAGYLSRAGDLFDRIEQDLAGGRDPSPAAVAVDELAADLSSVAAPGSLIDVLRQLASALRGAGDPHAALAEARQAFSRQQAPGQAGSWRAASTPGPGPGGTAREEWWR